MAALAEVVDGFANAGNATAKAILAQASAHLALHVRAAWNRLPSLPIGVWAAVGSVLRSRILADHRATAACPVDGPPSLPSNARTDASSD